jgi:hypothetical protein
MAELDDIFGAEEKETPKPSSDTTKVEGQVEKPEDKEVQKKAQQLENLNKAIQEAESQLRKKRQKPAKEDDEEELPKIDDNDPSSKAWNKRINDRVAPALNELEQAKTERRTFALREFLQGVPRLAADSTAVKQLMDTYEKIKTTSELTAEGIITDLRRAYAADHHQEILATQELEDIDEAKAQSAASSIGVSRGATTAYATRQPKPKKKLSEDDEEVLRKWGVTPEEKAKLYDAG